MNSVEELIDNSYDGIGLMSKVGGDTCGITSPLVGDDGRPRDSTGIHVMTMMPEDRKKCN